MFKKCLLLRFGLVLFSLFFFFAGTSWSGEKKSLSILYTGNILGQVPPRHG